jgi:hypothetical protein
MDRNELQVSSTNDTCNSQMDLFYFRPIYILFFLSSRDENVTTKLDLIGDIHIQYVVQTQLHRIENSIDLENAMSR